MKISDMIPEHRERAKCAIECYSGDGSATAGTRVSQDIGVGGRLCPVLGRKERSGPRATYHVYDLGRRMPLLVSDFEDGGAALLEAVGCSRRGEQPTEEEPFVLYSHYVQGLDCQAERHGDTMSRLLAPQSRGRSIRTAALGPNLVFLYSGSFDSSVARSVLLKHAASLPQPPVDDEALQREWVEKIGRRVYAAARHATAHADRCEVALAKAHRDAIGPKLMVRLLETHGGSLMASALEAVRALPLVESVTPQRDCNLFLVTRALHSDPFITASGTRVPAIYTGTWEVRIDLIRLNVFARNVAAPSHKFQHVHQGVDNSGRPGRPSTGKLPCMGGYKQAINLALERIDFAAVAMNVVEYLRGVTTTDSLAMAAFRLIREKPLPVDGRHRYEPWLKLLELNAPDVVESDVDEDDELGD